MLGATASSAPMSIKESPSFQCQLMDGFAVAVQVLLATIAFSSLLLKRLRENPRRPVLIWAMDTSKQAIAASGVHFANVFLAYVSGRPMEGGAERSNNPCVWYFLNILLDTTVGVGILYVFLRGLHELADFMKLKGCQSGFYGHPPKLSFWFRQLLLFLCAWFFVKLIVVLVLEHFPIFARFGEWLLKPLQQTNDTRLQVVVVMLIFPLIMNIIQAWLIDMVIKGKVNRKHIRASTGEANLVFDEASLLEDDDEPDREVGLFSRSQTDALQYRHLVDMEDDLDLAVDADSDFGLQPTGSYFKGSSEWRRRKETEEDDDDIDRSLSDLLRPKPKA